MFTSLEGLIFVLKRKLLSLLPLCPCYICHYLSVLFTICTLDFPLSAQKSIVREKWALTSIMSGLGILKHAGFLQMSILCTEQTWFTTKYFVLAYW